MKRAMIVLFALVALAMLLAGFKLRPELCAAFDHTPWGYPVIVDDRVFEFRAKPFDLEPFDILYTDADVVPPRLFIQHYSPLANEFWLLPLRDVGRPSVQGSNDLCIRRVYLVAE